MKIEIIRFPEENDWVRCLFLACVTRGRVSMVAPSIEWRKKILRCEHSPIRTLMFTIAMWDIPYFASVHFVRHKFGVEHCVKSQRSNDERSAARQDAPVNHVMDLNMQALITMCRKRLCTKADADTRKIMSEICDQIISEMPYLSEFLAPECVYRNGCPEFEPCEYYTSRPVKKTEA